MSTPATRSLQAVLRRALASGDELRLIVGEFDDPPADPRYAAVIVDGEALEVPKPPAETAGKAAYLLAAPGRMLVLGAGAGGSSDGGVMFVAKPGPPTAADGVNGALYLDLTSLRFWGPKAAGAWPAAAFARLVPLNPTYAQLRDG